MSYSIRVRMLQSIDEMYTAVRLQRTYWGNSLESVVPAHMLFSLASHGGHVLAAYSNDYMVGVLIGFLGTQGSDYTQPAAETLQVISKRMVVLPEYRSQGVGLKLKMEQRRLALGQGIGLVSWTFDPMLARNAYLNIRKLGGKCAEYTQDLYGVQDEGGLATLGSSDRLTLDWWVNDPHVLNCLSPTRQDTGLAQYLADGAIILNPTTAETDGTPWPAERIHSISAETVCVEIPLDYSSIVQNDGALGQAWRLQIRQLMKDLFARHYLATDFVRAQYLGRDRVFYVFRLKA